MSPHSVTARQGVGRDMKPDSNSEKSMNSLQSIFLQGLSPEDDLLLHLIKLVKLQDVTPTFLKVDWMHLTLK